MNIRRLAVTGSLVIAAASAVFLLAASPAAPPSVDSPPAVPLPPPPPPRDGPDVKWEYNVIADAARQVDLANKLGSEGWELVSVVPSEQGTCNLYFKRRK
jgi:hypothetical protein